MDNLTPDDLEKAFKIFICVIALFSCLWVLLAAKTPMEEFKILSKEINKKKGLASLGVP